MPLDLACITVDIDGWLFDGNTVDTAGAVCSWTDLAGWFDTPDLTTTPEQRSIGMMENVINVGGRSIVLSGYVHDPQLGNAIGLAGFAGLRNLKRAVGCMFASRLLTVNEPSLPLQALVRQSGPMRVKLGAHLADINFQLPLLAPDPRRYSTTPGLQTLTGLDTVTNAGDMVTPPICECTGGTDPIFQNNSIPGHPFVKYNGGVAGTLILDMANLTATISGLDVSANLSGNGGGPPDWWQLVPGANTIASNGGGGGTAIAWRDAYT